MPQDVVLRADDALIRDAKTLGYDSLVIVNGTPCEKHGVCLLRGEITERVPRTKKKGIVYLYHANGNDRPAFETGKVDIVYGLEYVERKDRVNQRQSGLNHILAKIAAKKNISLGFFLMPLLELSPSKRAQILGRLRQNLRLCHKYGVRVVIGTFAANAYELRNPLDIEAFQREILGYPLRM